VLDVGWLSYVDGLTIGIIAVSLAVRVIPLITEDSPRDSPYGPADERPLQSIISLMAHDPTDDGVRTHDYSTNRLKPSRTQF
jgi:hypothetical protein